MELAIVVIYGVVMLVVGYFKRSSLGFLLGRKRHFDDKSSALMAIYLMGNSLHSADGRHEGELDYTAYITLPDKHSGEPIMPAGTILVSLDMGFRAENNPIVLLRFLNLFNYTIRK